MSASRLDQLIPLIQACKRGDKTGQKLLYRQYYGFGMGIALRYCQNKEDAVEILNDAFLKIFTKGIQAFDPTANAHEGAFKTWLKRIVINTAIDHYRTNQKHYYHQDINEMPDISPQHIHTLITDTIAYDELLLLIKQLSPAYQTVFCLYAIDGFSHEEIADKLGISIGTSKSNLAKARVRLKEILIKEQKDEYSRHIG